MHHHLKRSGAAAIVGLAAMTAAGCSSNKPAAAPTSTTTPSGAVTASASYHGATIVVAGHGVAVGTPDTMTMTIGVQSSQASAQAALDQNNQEATTLENTLTAKGVAKKDVQTSNLSISPNYDKYGHITGYSVSNMVTVTLHGLGSAGQVIDAAATSVGNDISFNGVQLSIGDTSSLLRDARAMAVQQAIAHATQLAQAAGMKLGVIREIDDTGTQVPTPEFSGDEGIQGTAGAATPIEAGSQQLSVDVSVTFAVENA